ASVELIAIRRTCRQTHVGQGKKGRGWMSADPHAHDSHNVNSNEQGGPAAGRPGSRDTISRVESAPSGVEGSTKRLPLVSSGLVSLCVLASQHQRSADPV